MAPMSKKQLSKLGLAALAVISIAERRRKQRSTSVGRRWARPHIMARNSTGAFAKLLPVLREREPSQFRNFLRMPVTLLRNAQRSSKPRHACCAAEHTIWMSKRRGLGQLATSQSAPSHAGCRTNLPFLCGLFGLA